MKPRYTVIIQWSDEDNSYVVTLPEFTTVAQPCTHGATYVEAATRAQEVIETYIELYEQDGKPLPVPQPLQTAA